MGGKMIRTGTGKWIKKRVKVKRSPNLQKTTLVISGQEKEKIICTSCLKKFKKEGKVKVAYFVGQ